MGIPHSRKPAHEIDRAGGAYVRRRFNRGGVDLMPGDLLTAEEVGTIPRANLNALINTGKLELYPAAPGALSGPTEQFAVHIGGGKYLVVAGQRVTEQAVTRAEADAIINGTEH